MKFKFPLEKLLTQRHIQADIERRRFLEKKNEYDLEAQKRDEMIVLKEQVKTDLHSQVQSSSDWQNDVNMKNAFLTGQDLRIEKQNKRLSELEKEVEVLRQILLKALTEARMVEKLKEKQKAAFLKEAMDSEQKELDEIGTIKGTRDQNR